MRKKFKTVQIGDKNGGMSLRSSCFYSKSSQTMQMGLKSVSCPRAVLSPSQIQDYIISTRKVDDEEGGGGGEEGDQREEKNINFITSKTMIVTDKMSNYS